MTTKEKDGEYQKALSKAREEFSVLTVGKNNMSFAEIESIRDYAKKRTNLRESSDALNAEQRAWKTIYDAVSNQMEKTYGKENINQIDEQKTELESLELAKQEMEKQMGLGREIETLFIQQGAGLIVHWQKNENNYAKALEVMTNKMIKDQSLDNADRLKLANEILTLSEKYQSYLIKDLFEQHDKIYELLTHYQNFSEKPLWKLAGGEKMNAWIKLSWELYKNRTAAITAVKNHVETDKALPNLIIKNKGDASVKLTEDEVEEFTEKIASYGVLIGIASKKEDEISKERDPLSEHLLGKVNEYMKSEDKGMLNKENQATVQEKIGKKMKWGIVITLSIIALSWGISTAIGVFILGMIIINVLSK